MKTICIYHSADLDGHCAGAIVKKALPSSEMVEMNYGDKTPWELIDKNTRVVIVDFSLPPADMLALRQKAGEVIWCDHHKTALADAETHGYADLYGLREIGRAGCELAWQEFFPDHTAPLAVFLLGRYDVWDHSDFRVLPFQYGMRLCDDTKPESHVWQKILQTEDSFDLTSTLSDIRRQGETILRYQSQQNAMYAKAAAFEIDIDGLHVIACNAMLTNSKLFDSVYDPGRHDAMLVFGWRKGEWKCSLYTSTPGVDVSATAKKFCGGGHAGAAGFSCQDLPFNLSAAHDKGQA